jgi:hypothetical protein
MIVRYALKCETCEQPHTVRIGMGLDSSQTHKFPCCGCSEEIVLRMDVAKHDWRIVCEENCEPILEVAGAPVGVARKPAPLGERERQQLMQLGADLELAWSHRAATAATRKRILRTALNEIVDAAVKG